MIEVLDSNFVYVTIDEKMIINQLFRIKDAAAIYYRKGKKIAYHWLLNPITVRKLKLATK